MASVQDAVNQVANYCQLLGATKAYVINFTNKPPSQWSRTLVPRPFHLDPENDIEIERMDEQGPSMEVRVITIVYSTDWTSIQQILM